jgi:hypothetical protein
MSLADFFWLGIAFNATRTRMAPPVAIAATRFFDLQQEPIRRVLQPRRITRSGSRIQQHVCVHGFLLLFTFEVTAIETAALRGDWLLLCKNCATQNAEW